MREIILEILQILQILLQATRGSRGTGPALRTTDVFVMALKHRDREGSPTGRLGIERRYQIASAAPIAEFAEIDALPHSQI